MNKMTPAETFLALSSVHHQVCFDCSGFLLLTADSLCPLSCFTSPAPALISLPSLQIPGILFVFGHWKISVMLRKHPNHHHLFILRSIKVPSAAVAPEGECRGCSPLRVPDWRSPDTCDYVGKRQSSCSWGDQVSPRWMFYLFYFVLGLFMDLTDFDQMIQSTHFNLKHALCTVLSLLQDDIHCLFFLLIRIFWLWFVVSTDPALSLSFFRT